MADETLLADGAADAQTAAALAGPPDTASIPFKAPASKAAPAAPVDDAEDEAPSAPRITIPGGQRGAVKMARVEWLTGAFEGTWMKTHINPRRGVFGDIASGDDAKQDAALAPLIHEHNFVDVETAEPLPQPMTVEGLALLPMDQYAAVVRAVVDAIQRGSALPKSG